MVGIAELDGIGERHVDRLRDLGIGSSDELLASGASKRGRRELSKATRLGEKRIHEWVKRADLLRVPGISIKYSNLLEAIGVETVRDLRRRSASQLAQRIRDLNDRRSVVSRTPNEDEVKRWIDAAKELPLVLKRW
jgi:nucleotidyltransferase/DNA polymerase involved in DNA repair